MKTKFYQLFFLMIGLFLISCKEKNKPVDTTPIATNESQDVHTYARSDEAVVKHLSLELNVDFDLKKLSGTAAYDIEVHPGADTIRLDVKDLDIQQVTVDGEKSEFKLGVSDKWLGQSLNVPVKESSKKLVIAYSTRPEAEALQWLNPSQTAGKKYPYLFTQGEAILTRTWIPIQDSPGIRLTYDAKITVPKELMAVMSASNPQVKTADGIYTFSMNQPIPSYLIALAVGDIAFKSVGTRTGVYTEPVMLEKAAWELSDMEKMVSAAESLYGPYQWERYDIIILPPSFPFGGMENPRLTFATPTIIAGDKSLVALVAHELAHSWSGNLVTNATWNDFWLNEGFTVYFELRIMEAVYGKSYSDMLANLGFQSLQSTIADVDPKDSHLFLDLKGRNPDDGMNDVAYEKGALFLRMLEEKAGRTTLDAFLRKYFEEHKFQSMSTEKFLAYLDENLLKPNHLEVNVNEWVYSPGLPKDFTIAQSERFQAVDKVVSDFLAGKPAKSLDTKAWSTHEWLHFIQALPDSISTVQMKDLDNTFGFTKTGNSEIKEAWFKLAINQGYGPQILPAIREFLVNVGRRKFLTPLYTAMTENGMTAEAKSIFAEAKANYHSIALNTIQGVLDKAK
jgi:aminopeptidase N